jgi:hypothetical protein
MRNIFNALVAALFMTMSATFNLYGQGVDFNRTLRVDYIFSGTDKETEIAVGELRELGEWAGRRHNLDKLPVAGNGRLVMSSNGEVLYTMSFSTLFQEWQATEEATRVRKAFENVFLLPMPAQKAEILVELYDLRGVVRASLKHEVDPSDILNIIGSNPIWHPTTAYKRTERGFSKENPLFVCVPSSKTTQG